MCVPVAVGLAVASAAAAIGGQVTKGIGEAQNYRAQAQIADNNQRIANNQASDSIQNTNLEAARYSRETSQLKGQQQAMMAANGVDLNFGSAVDVQKDTAGIAAQDLTQLYKSGNERTKGFEINAFNYQSAAAVDRAKASGAVTGAVFGSISTALGAASQINKMSSKQQAASAYAGPN
jgi:hypothetical protein